MTATPARARARRWAGAGMIAFWAAFAMLALGAELPLPDAIAVALLAVLVPALAVAQVPLAREVEIERLPAYWSSIGALWLLGTGCWIVGTRGRGPAAIGFVPPDPMPVLAWTLALTAAALGIILAFRALAAWSGTGETELLRELLPRTRGERRAFALLSLAAGFGEEIAYRGYLIGVLSPLLGTAGAAVASSVAFGLVHAYQGPLGMARTGLMGGALAWGYLASGSLWAPIAAHVAVDVLAGIVLGERLMPPPAPAGVRTDSSTTET